MKPQSTVIARVEHGSPALSQGQRETLAKFFQNYEGKFVSLTASAKGKPRSLKVNAYYHAEFVERCAAHDGYTHQEMHEVLKWEFLEHLIIPRNGKDIEVARSTTELSTTEFNEFLDKVTAFYGAEYGMRFMTPEEWYAAQISFSEEI